MKITLKQLQVFVLTAKYQSISEAAIQCYLSQPAASMSLKQLEQALDVPLFERIGKRLILNSHGDNLLSKAIAVLDQASEIEFSAKHPATDLTGRLKIGCSLTVGNYLLPAYIAQFKQQHPNLKFEIIMSNTQKIIEKTLALDLDLSLIEGPGENQKNLLFKKWQDDEMVIICRSKHPLTKKKKVTYQDLENFPWVLREQGSGTTALIKQHALNKFTPSSEIILTDFEAIKNYVANSNCLSCVSSSIMHGVNQNKLKIISNSGFNFSRPITLVLNNIKYQSQACSKFIEYLIM